MKSNKHNFTKRFFALALTVCILLSVMPTARAQGEPTPDSTTPSETVSNTTMPDTTVPGTAGPDATIPSTPAPELTTFQKLAAATTLDAFETLWLAEENAADIATLGLQQRQQLKVLCQSFEILDEEAAVRQAAILEQLDTLLSRFCALCGMENTHADKCPALCTCQSEVDSHADTCPLYVPADRGPILTSPAPRASNPAMNVNFGGITLTEAGDQVLTGWNYGTENLKNLTISLSGLDTATEYQIKVELDRSLYFVTLPETPADKVYTVTSTQKQGLLFQNKGNNNYYIHENSRDVIYTFHPAQESMQITTQLLYDIVLWNRWADQSLRWDDTAPILKVTLLKDGTVVSEQSLQDCYSGSHYRINNGNTYMTRGVKFILSTTKNAQYDFFVNQTPVMQIRAWQDTGYYYLDTFTATVELPRCTIDGTLYIMEVEKIVPTENESFPISYQVKDGILTVTIENIRKSSHGLVDIYLKFPSALASKDLSGRTFKFLYKADYQINNDLSFTPAEQTGKSSYYQNKKAYIILDGNYGGKLNFYNNARGYADVEWSGEGVASLGSVGLRNDGNLDVSNIILRNTYDIDNNGAIGVTSMNLLSGTDLPSITVRYTMVDANGNLITDAGGQPFTITIPNPHYGKTTSGSNRKILFNRTMLPAELQGYYFKTVEYPMGTIESSVIVGVPYNYRSHSAPGVYWGYALKEYSGNIRSTVQVVSATDARGSYDCTGLTQTIVTQITDNKEALITMSANFSKDEILAGNSGTLTITGSIPDSISTQSCTYLDGIRIALKLPKGVVVQESSVKAMLTATGKAIPCIGIEQVPDPTGAHNIYILKFAEGYPIGYATETLTSLPNGRYFQVKVDLVSEISMSDTTLYAQEILSVAGNGISLYNTSPHRIPDVYDITGVKGTSDYVLTVPVDDNDSMVIRSSSVSLDVTEKLTVNGVQQTGTELALNSPDDAIVYQMNLKNRNGGVADNFHCYFAIPQELANGSGDRIIMSGPGQVTLGTGSTPMKLQYTTADVTYDNVRTLSASQWSDTVSDWSKVTMVRLVSSDGTPIQNGSDITFSIPMAYAGNHYSYHAGASAALQANGDYSYVRGLNSIPVAIPSEGRNLFIHYQAESTSEFTLTAAYNRTPTAPNVNSYTLDTDLSFYNAQTFTVKNLTMHNMELVNLSDDQLAAMNSTDSNWKFKILTDLNGAAGAALASDVELGSLTRDLEAVFNFDLYNGNALTEATQTKYVTFDLCSDYVTIPVRINIKRELATVEATASTIIPGKQYLQFSDVYTTADISLDSAFTAQFVSAGINASNYTGRILTLKTPFPAGTTIAMLDYSFPTPRYARYVCTGSETQIDLTAFKIMGTNTPYSINQSAESFTEKLLFIVDFQGTTCSSGSNTLQLLIKGTGGVPDATTTVLKVNTHAPRSFGISSSAASVPVGSSFTLNYSVTAAGAADSRYNGRKLAFIITEDPSAPIPSDAILYVDGTAYTRNSRGQFIIPLSDAQSAGNYSFDVKLVSQYLQSNAQSCKLSAALWVSATSQADSPLLGQLAAGPCSISVYAVKAPSLEVTAMSDRVLTTQELSSPVTVTYETLDIPAGGSVTLEVQKLIGNAYTTNSIYLETVNGSSAHNQGVYAVGTNGGSLTLQFNPNLEIENYQLLFTVLDSSGNKLITVPYRFIVVNP